MCVCWEVEEERDEKKDEDQDGQEEQRGEWKGRSGRRRKRRRTARRWYDGRKIMEWWQSLAYGKRMFRKWSVYEAFNSSIPIASQ